MPTLKEQPKRKDLRVQSQSLYTMKSLPLVVISSALSTVKKARLLEVLKNHKGAIAWSIADIKGIDSSFYSHKTLMEDKFKPSFQPQRRVNPNIKEVVKKEVIKLLDAGLIYPISDSPWHKAYWPIKNCNLKLTKAGANRLLQINELDEIRLDVYESSISYRERTKRWHDKWIEASTNYEKGDKVLLFNSRLRLFPKKLKSRWYGPFSVCKDMKNGAIELYDEDGNKLIVNKQRVKPYQKSVLDTNKDDDITLDDEGEVT
nr:protein NYNRIN-like [Tanacetum cinerariifolium]